MITQETPYAIIVESDTATIDTGRRFRLPYADPENHAVRLLHGAAALFAGRDEGVLMITEPLPPDADPLLQEAGWKFTKIRGLSEGGWTMFTRPGSPTVHLCIRRAIKLDDCPLFHPEESAMAIAGRLADYHKAVGVAWRGVPGMAGHSLLRSLYVDPGPGKQPLWNYARPEAPNSAPLGAVGGLLWKRPLPDCQPGWEYVHQFDVRSAYLAAAGVVELPWSGLRRVCDMQFDKDYAGYWLVRASDLPGDVIGVVDSRRVWEDQVWLTTPIMCLVQDLGYTPEVVDAYVSAKTRRILRPWAERLRDGLYAAEKREASLLRTSIKDTYARSIGMLARKGGRIYRPDWADFTIDMARANFVRKLRGTLKEARNVQLIKVATDSMYLLSDSPEQPYAHGEGPRIGNLRYEGCSSLTSLMETSNA